VCPYLASALKGLGLLDFLFDLVEIFPDKESQGGNDQK